MDSFSRHAWLRREMPGHSLLRVLRGMRRPRMALPTQPEGAIWTDGRWNAPAGAGGRHAAAAHTGGEAEWWRGSTPAAAHPAERGAPLPSGFAGVMLPVPTVYYLCMRARVHFVTMCCTLPAVLSRWREARRADRLLVKVERPTMVGLT
jgi:hypothetical protein